MNCSSYDKCFRQNNCPIFYEKLYFCPPEAKLFFY
nr:MAG TPA: hypothetical protein [Caudoviricetes sp.]